MYVDETLTVQGTVHASGWPRTHHTAVSLVTFDVRCSMFDVSVTHIAAPVHCTLDINDPHDLVVFATTFVSESRDQTRIKDGKYSPSFRRYWRQSP
jgi:hypothetical protein